MRAPAFSGAHDCETMQVDARLTQGISQQEASLGQSCERSKEWGRPCLLAELRIAPPYRTATGSVTVPDVSDARLAHDDATYREGSTSCTTIATT